MKKVLGIIGAGLLAGAVAYIILNKTNESTAAKPTKFEKDFENTSHDSHNAMIKEDIHNEDTEYSDIKESFVNIVSERHKQASKIIKDTVENIYTSSKVYEDDSRELKRISDELDELLKEENQT